METRRRTRSRPIVVAMAGNIGSGKTTLARLLSARMGWRALLEEAEGNPHLEDFYRSPDRWSFTSQVWFLLYRSMRESALQKMKGGVILVDRVVAEDGLFAQAHHLQGWMTTREYRTYRLVFDRLNEGSAMPDMVVYLQASVPTLVRRIQMRGHQVEASIDLSYLECLQNVYDRWAASLDGVRSIVLNMDEIDFLANRDDLARVARAVTGMVQAIVSAGQRDSRAGSVRKRSRARIPSPRRRSRTLRLTTHGSRKPRPYR